MRGFIEVMNHIVRLYQRIKEHIAATYHKIMFILNLLCLLLGIWYINSNRDNIAWNIYGVLMVFVFFINIRTAYKLNRGKGLSIFYLITFSITMFLVAIVNTIVSLVPSNQLSQSILTYCLLHLILIMGAGLSIIHETRIKESVTITQKKSIGITNVLSPTAIIILSLLLVSGLFVVFYILQESSESFVEFFISTYSLFFSLAFLSLGTLIMKLHRRKHHVFHSIIRTLTILIVVVCLLPLLSTPYLIIKANHAYHKAFGEMKELSLYETYFRSSPFSITEYFYGTKSDDYDLKENILYYEGKEGVDKGLKLYFDVYTPPKDKGLPGNHSVLLRIHGGGWTTGDKGIFNFSQMNKYFASRGYVVFDIQYGLYNKDKFIEFVPVKKSRQGDFLVDDMIRHIGIFTKYLAKNSEFYHANLDSVFISGGSAGGQLALASGLAMNSGNYKDIFDESITIKGMIPFYPANGLANYVGIGGDAKFVDPIYLVDKKSPPCLIYQGDHDGLVNPFIVERFYKEYQLKENNKCAIIAMPFAGHASDLYFSSYYNQVFLYYMERFIYQYQ